MTCIRCGLAECATDAVDVGNLGWREPATAGGTRTEAVAMCQVGGHRRIPHADGMIVEWIVGGNVTDDRFCERDLCPQ